MSIVYEKWMRGPARVRFKIVEALQAAIPGIQDGMRTQWNMSEEQFPDVVNFDIGEPREFANNDEDNLVTTSVRTTSDFRPVDFDSLIGPEFRVRYSVRVYSWVKNRYDDSDDAEEESTYDTVVRLRDLMTTLMRASLLYDLSLGTDDMEVKADTMREQFSDIDSLNGNRWVAGVFHEFDILVDETIIRPSLGTSEQISVDATTPIPEV